MITRLDHAVLICPDIQAGIATYETLLGVAPNWRAEDSKGGSASALFKVENTALELIAPMGSGPVGARLGEMLAADGPRLTSLAFSSDDLNTDHRLMARRGLEPGEIAAHTSEDSSGRGIREWHSYRCPDAVCGGIKTFIFQPGTDPTTDDAAAPIDQSHAHALDHLVINTSNPDRAIAHYGARLGLDFRLDRTAEQWKTRFMFFRTGGLTMEIIHRLDQEHDPFAADTIWGLTWAVADLTAAHERLSAAGLRLSEVRTGRKPGSTVFSVKDRTLGIPTLFIAHEKV